MATAVQIQDRVDIQAILQTAVAVPASLRKAVYFIDSDEIPLDRRYFEVTKSDFADELDSTLNPYAFASLHFSQLRVPTSLQIARWAQSASNPYWVAGGDLETTLATWAAISGGSIRVVDVDTPTNYEDVTGIDFSAMTDISQLPTVLTAAVQDIDTPSVVGLNTAVWSYDVYGRLIMTMPGTGASAVYVTMEAAESGTDISTLLDVANETAVEGIDAETIASAIDALRAVDDTGFFYTAKFTTSSDEARATEILSMAAKVESLNKFAVVTADDTDIKNSAVDTDIFSQLQTLGYKRTMGIYFENISSRPLIAPEAAVLGAVIPADEGAVDFAYVDLTGVSESGYTSSLSFAETTVVAGRGSVAGKCGCVIEAAGGYTYLYRGLTFGGVELRLIVGRDWFVNTIASALFTYRMQEDIVGFDKEFLGAAETIIRETGEEAVNRKILVDTAARPFTVTLPDEDDFTQAERASHYAQITEAFQGYLNSSVTDMQIIGTWTI